MEFFLFTFICPSVIRDEVYLTEFYILFLPVLQLILYGGLCVKKQIINLLSDDKFI